MEPHAGLCQFQMHIIARLALLVLMQRIPPESDGFLSTRSSRGVGACRAAPLGTYSFVATFKEVS